MVLKILKIAKNRRAREKAVLLESAKLESISKSDLYTVFHFQLSPSSNQKEEKRIIKKRPCSIKKPLKSDLELSCKENMVFLGHVIL